MVDTADVRTRIAALQFELSEKERLLLLLLCDIADKLDYMVSASGEVVEKGN